MLDSKAATSASCVGKSGRHEVDHASRPINLDATPPKYPGQGALDFELVNREALRHFAPVLKLILPGGKRVDRRREKLQLNRYTGRWFDPATNDKGIGAVSLVAHIARVNEAEAARLITDLLGLPKAGGAS